MENEQTILQETAAVAPLLATIEKVAPYQIPNGYFDQVPSLVLEKLAAGQETPVVSIQFYRKWMVYAAAALVAGVLLTSALLFSDSSSVKEADKYSMEDMALTLDQVPDEALASYLEENTAITNEALFLEQNEPLLPLAEHMQALSNEKLDEYLLENNHLIPLEIQESTN